jgi:cytoskeletal protein RodZ
LEAQHILDAVSIVTAIIAIIAGIAGFFTWANYQTRKQHERFKKSDVVAALENVISSNSFNHDK